MKFLKFDSVLPGLKHEHVTDFNGRDRLLSSWIINEFLNDKITAASCQTNMSHKRYIQRYKQKNELRLTSFQKPQLQSVSIFLKFVHPRLLCNSCVIYTFLKLFQQIFLYSTQVCWQLPLFKLW